MAGGQLFAARFRHGVRTVYSGVAVTELAADQPAYGRLRGTLGDADGFGEILITDGDGRVAALLLAGKPEVDEKARRAAIVSDEVAQENVGDIRVEFQHGYTDR